MILTVAGIGTYAVAASSDEPQGISLLADDAVPQTLTDTDRQAVELGLHFQVTAPVVATGVQFYKGPRNTGTHKATLWSAYGRRLGGLTFQNETSRGLQSASFDDPIALSPGTYTVSYTAPRGRYSVDEQFFNKTITNGPLTAGPGAGVYTYRAGSFPTGSYRGSNYGVDIVVQPTGGSTSPEPTESATSGETTVPSVSASPTESASPSEPAPSESESTVPPVPPADDDTALDLPRIPWEGGSAYWKKFPDAADWTDPSFFPIGVWFGGIGSNSDAQWDRSHGINWYAGMDSSTPFSLFEDNDLYWIGDKLNSSFDESSHNWPGVFMGDEVDGTSSSTAAGFSQLQAVKDRWAGTGKFLMANYTTLVIGPDMKLADQQRFVNDFPDAVSVDQYWYTTPYCQFNPYRGSSLAVPVAQSSCASSSSYGKTVNGLTLRDSSDGVLKPRWNYVELGNPSPTEYKQDRMITPAQIKGAAMNSIINEARGLIYFNQSFQGSCQSGKMIRDAQLEGSKFCGYANVQAMGEVNNLIHSLARVLNTQSYDYSFGSGLDTMLKTYDGSAYIFAMTDGGSGSRSFKLPPGVSGTSVEVVGENRTIPVSGGSFSDSFAAESTYHIYKIAQ